MKKIYTLFLFVILAFVSYAQFPAPYCAEEYVSGTEPITLVKFNTINRPSADSLDGPEHEDYTNDTTKITQGISYLITLKGNTAGNTFTNYFTVFIDWNQDNDFTDADERFNIGTIMGSTGIDAKQLMGSILVPLTATTGYTRMRVVKHWNSYQSTSCLAGGFSHFGEAEDYTVEVLVGTNCTGTPPVTTSNGPSNMCEDSLITVSLSGLTTALGITYQWQSTTIGGTVWTDIVGANDAISTFPQAAGGRDYRCLVTCTNGGLFTYSSKISVITDNCSPPVNDKYCDAIALILDGTSDCQNTFFATSAGDPTYSCSPPNNTTWYTYTPSTTGDIEVQITAPLNGDTLYGRVAAFTATGSCPGALTFTNVTPAVFGGCIAFGGNGSSYENFKATLNAGVEYYFMVDGISGAYGKYCIELNTVPLPPANCSNNIIPVNNATNVSPDTVRFKWSVVAGADNYDVYFGTINPPPFAANITGDSAIATGLAYNTTYYWYVIPKNSGGFPTGCDVNITSFTTAPPPPPPANDSCDFAVTLNNGITAFGNTTNATQSLPATICKSLTGTADDDVWFKFTTINAGDAIITIKPDTSTLDIVAIGYDGVCGSLVQLTCADSTASGSSETLYMYGLNAATTYYIRIFSYSSSKTRRGKFNIVANGSALPVSFSKISVTKYNGSNQITWTTANEQSNKGFEVQRSTNGKEFNTIIFIKSKAINGNSASILNYSYNDVEAPKYGTIYYRLKQIDINGKYSHTNVVTINQENSKDILIQEIFPNPATSKINVSIAAPKSDIASINILDVSGRLVFTKNIIVVEGITTQTIMVNELQSGSYFIQVNANNKKSNIARFNKQ